jgi:thiamine-phosphate pyrophosphorylase
MNSGGMKRPEILRILDANFNRSREGLRVCEEITRFVMNDKKLTAEIKKLRHAVSAALKNLPCSSFELAACRNVRADVGKEPSRLEKERKNAVGIFLANIQRTKESLRVLEETSKPLNPAIGDSIKKIRFHAYAVEKKVLKKLEALCDH